MGALRASESVRSHLVAALIIAIGCLAVDVAPASADPSAIYVTITAQNQSSAPAVPPISDSTLAANEDVAGAYITVFPTGEYPSGTFTGMSTLRLVNLAGVAPNQLISMTVTDRASDELGVPYISTTLTGTEATQGFSDPNAGDTHPSFAVFADLGGDSTCGFYLIRPMRNTEDSNGDDELSCTTTTVASDGLDVALSVAGSVFTVGTPAPPTSTTIKANQTVQFGAPLVQLNGVRQTSGLTYSWNFGDGQTGTGPSPTVTYRTPGSYKVFVTASDGSGDSGVSPTPVLMQVGPAPGTGTTTTPGGGGTAQTGGGAATPGTSSGADEPTQQAAPVSPGASAKKQQVKQKSKQQTKQRTTAPKLSRPTALGSGGSGGTSGSGTSHGAAGGAGGAGGAVGAAGRQAGGSVLGRNANSSSAPGAPPKGLVGVVIASSAPLSPSELTDATQTPAQQLAAARSSIGSGATARWLGWLFEAAVLVIVLVLGGVLEFRPRALYRRVLRW
jgi:PKD domain